MRPAFWFPALLLLLLGAAFAQEPIEVTPCQLQEHPTSYDRKVVSVRGHISLAFEDFSLDADECEGNSSRTWLVFGGDVKTPTIYCCGPDTRTKGKDIQVEDVRIPLKRDAQLEDLLGFLTAGREREPNGEACDNCHYYRVTATLVGHFFAGKPWKRPSDGKVFYMGYGHIGCCSLLAIEEVFTVDAVRTEIPMGDFDCSQKEWRWSGNRDDARSMWKAIEASNPHGIEPEVLAQQVYARHAITWGDTKPPALNSDHSDMSKEGQRSEWYKAVAADRLLTYQIELTEFDWLTDELQKKTSSWVPTTVLRIQCVPHKVN